MYGFVYLFVASNPISLSFFASKKDLHLQGTLSQVLASSLDCQYDGLEVAYHFLLNHLLGGHWSLREYRPPKKQEERSTFVSG